MNHDGSCQTNVVANAHGPTWSPDGKKMAFVRDRYIYIIDCCEDEEGSTNEAKRLTDGPERDREPVWSPDGTELAFTRADIGKVGGGGVDLRNTDVYKINVDGSSETRLTHTYSSKYPEHNAVWSPSGDHLAFIRGSYQVTDDVSSNTIYLMKSDGSQPTVVRWVPDAAGMDLDWR
jgi:Tol biopolymer transport system component